MEYTPCNDQGPDGGIPAYLDRHIIECSNNDFALRSWHLERCTFTDGPNKGKWEIWDHGLIHFAMECCNMREYAQTLIG